jgi:uncharacterized repeat protein (TIGR01451 family)
MKSVLKSCRPSLPVTIALTIVALFLTLQVCTIIVQAAEALLEENFEYGGAAGDLTTVSGGNWAAHSGAFLSPVQYVPSSLSLPEYSSSGDGGSATFAGGSGSREDVNRSFAAQSSGTVYYAALVNLSSATTGDYFLHLKDATTNFRGRLFAQDSDGNLLFGLSSSGAPISYGATRFSYNTTYLAVIKYDVGNGNSALYILDSCSSTEPETPLVTSTGTANAMSAIAIRQGGASMAGAIDGIRVGTTWAEAVHCGPITKSVSPAVDVKYHGTVTYTVVLENPNATDDPNAMLTDTLPVEVDFARWVEQPAGAAVSDDEITWSGTIAANTTITFTFVVTHVGDYGDIVNNTATFSATSFISEATASFNVETPFDVGILKAADPTEVQVMDGAGALVTYTLTISNYSAAIDTARVTVTDLLPAGFVYVSDDSGVVPTGSGTTADPLVWVFADPIAAGEGLTYQVVVLATDAITRSGSYNNEVTVDTEPPDPAVGNNSANAAVTVYRFVPIATARAGSNGELFAIEGQVIYVPGTFGTSEWGLQDSSGGISVYYSPPPAAALGDRVRLVATLGAYNNQEQMVAPVLYFANLGAGPEVDPIFHATGDIGTGTTEGWLVQIKGSVSGLDPANCGQAGNFQFNVDDGTGPAVVFVDIDTGVNLCDDVVNGDVVRVTGFSTQYQTTYEIKPRQPADIQEFYRLYLPLIAKNYP